MSACECVLSMQKLAQCIVHYWIRGGGWGSVVVRRHVARTDILVSIVNYLLMGCSSLKYYLLVRCKLVSCNASVFSSYRRFNNVFIQNTV